MKKSEELIKAEKWIGKYALLNKNLVEIVHIEELEREEKKKISGGWLFQKYEYIKYLDLKNVFWINVGDNSGRMTSSTLSNFYDWDKLISDANIIINQVKKFVLNNPSKLTD